MPCSGEARDSATGGSFPPPTARRTSLPSCRANVMFPTAAFLLSTRRGSSSTRWCTPSAIRSPARRATRCSWRDDAAAHGLADGDRVVVRSEQGELEARVHLSASSDPATCRCSSPKATSCCEPARATSRAFPTTTPSSPSNAGESRTAPRGLRPRVRRAAGGAGTPLGRRASSPHGPQRPVLPRYRRRRRDPSHPARSGDSGAQ